MTTESPPKESHLLNQYIGEMSFEQFRRAIVEALELTPIAGHLSEKDVQTYIDHNMERYKAHATALCDLHDKSIFSDFKATALKCLKDVTELNSKLENATAGSTVAEFLFYNICNLPIESPSERAARTIGVNAYLLMLMESVKTGIPSHFIIDAYQKSQGGNYRIILAAAAVLLSLDEFEPYFQTRSKKLEVPYLDCLGRKDSKDRQIFEFVFKAARTLDEVKAKFNITASAYRQVRQRLKDADAGYLYRITDQKAYEIVKSETHTGEGL